MTYDLCVTLFPRDDVQLVRTDKMMILYVAVRWIKISLLQAMIRQWLTNFKMTGSIKCMFLISLTISNLGITQGPNVPSIANPRTQGHILKKGSNDSLVFFYPGQTNQIQSPNPDFRLYDQGSLIIPLEEPRKSSVSGDRVTRSASRRVAGAQQPPQQPSSQLSPQPQP
jgi:hypothetical protein